MRRFRFKPCRSCLHKTVPVINANQLKKARLKAGLTQGQVAKKMNYHPLYYSRVEKGHVNPSDAFLVAAGRCLFGPRALQKEYKTR